jgi:hypothetical protein
MWLICGQATNDVFQLRNETMRRVYGLKSKREPLKNVANRLRVSCLINMSQTTVLHCTVPY